jgi:DNA-binding MarR family transcriptional regulator
MSDSSEQLRSCLYFSVTAVARTIGRIAEEEFQFAGLSPSLAFVMMLVIEHPGVRAKELAARLQLAPSTVTRFLDVLENRGLVIRCAEGRTMLLHATKSGKALNAQIHRAWHNLYRRYTAALGEEKGESLNRLLHEASTRLK